MTAQPLTDRIEQLMMDCEGILFTLRSPQWNALRDHIRELLPTQEEASDFIRGHHADRQDDCVACRCKVKLQAIAEGKA